MNPVRPIGPVYWMLIAVWTLVAAGSLLWNFHLVEQDVYKDSLLLAKATFERDLIFRRWNAGHGGVYVPITEKTRPNPYLGFIPDRDVTTTSGKKLTLINPAYMTRQVHEMMAEVKGGSRGHITSLNPIRPENRADPWETESLRKFEQGESEVYGIEKMGDGREYFRYMHKMLVEKPCLKCHAAQGYKLGDIRGGISVSIPMGSVKADVIEEKKGLAASHGTLWVLGLGVIFLAGLRQTKAEASIRDSEGRIKQLLESTQEAIYGLDMQGNCTFANPACLRLLGYDSPDELLGRHMHDLIHHTRPDGSPYPARECHINEVLQKGEGTHVDDEVLWRRDGTSFAAEYWSNPVYLDGKINGAVVAFADVSERRLAREHLDSRLDELERFQKATVQREFRIKELRDELAAMKATQDSGGKHETD